MNPAPRKRRKNRLSLGADVMMFILGVLTFIFVDRTLGIGLVLFSLLLYLVYVWLTRRFERIQSKI